MLPNANVIKCQEADYLLFSGGDLIANVLFRTGQWEPHLQAISSMFYNAVEAPLVLDIGANIGAYSIPIAKKSRPPEGWYSHSNRSVSCTTNSAATLY